MCVCARTIYNRIQFLSLAEISNDPTGTAVDDTGRSSGGAVGPFWSQIFEKASNKLAETCCSLSTEDEGVSLDINFKSKVSKVTWNKCNESGSSCAMVHLSSGESHEADIIVNATGVEPRTQWLKDCEMIRLDEESNGVVVDCSMKVRFLTTWPIGHRLVSLNLVQRRDH